MDQPLGLSHITFLVRDLERTARLFCEGLGATEIYDSGARHFSRTLEKFFTLGGLWIAAMLGEPPREKSYGHVAFQVPAAALPAYRARLQALEVTILPDRPRVGGEGESLYFYDYDNHLLELHSGTLAERLASYRDLALG